MKPGISLYYVEEHDDADDVSMLRKTTIS